MSMPSLVLNRHFLKRQTIRHSFCNYHCLNGQAQLRYTPSVSAAYAVRWFSASLLSSFSDHVLRRKIRLNRSVNLSSVLQVFRRMRATRDAYLSSLCNSWVKTKFYLGASVATYGFFCTYIFYHSNYNLYETFLRIKLNQQRCWRFICSGPYQCNQAERNSSCSTGLPLDIAKLISVYFIDVDLNQQNGVRISDILQLLKKIGVSCEHEAVKQFTKSGKGRYEDEKKNSGCSLQNVLDLFEALYLSNEKHSTKSHSDPSKCYENGLPDSFLTTLTEFLCKHISNKEYDGIDFLTLTSSDDSLRKKEISISEDNITNEKERVDALIQRYRKIHQTVELTDAQRERYEYLLEELYRLKKKYSEILYNKEEMRMAHRTK